jgi:hypothetical protein
MKQKTPATVHCGLCNKEIYNGRSISNAAYKALQRHIYIDHADNNKNGARPKGIVVFREPYLVRFRGPYPTVCRERVWTMELGVYPHEWHGSNYRNSLPGVVRTCSPLARRKQDESRQAELATEFCKERGIPYTYEHGYFHLTSERGGAPEQTLDEAREAYDAETRWGEIVKRWPDLAAEEAHRLYLLIDAKIPTSIDYLTEETGYGVATFLVHLLGIELRDLLEQLPGKVFLRKPYEAEAKAAA